MKLERFIALADHENPKVFLLHDGDRKQLDFINDYGGFDGRFYIVGYEFGPTHLVHADSESSAWDAWLDEQPTIPNEELHEAWDTYSKLRQLLTTRGAEDDQHLRSFCNRWAPVYFEMCRNDPSCDWDLSEGYEFQANASGTGVVEVGHYAWIRSADLFDIEIE